MSETAVGIGAGDCGDVPGVNGKASLAIQPPTLPPVPLELTLSTLAPVRFVSGARRLVPHTTLLSCSLLRVSALPYVTARLLPLQVL